MGNCLRKCFGRFDRRRAFLHTRYSVEKEASIEFENLMDKDDVQNEMSKLVTEREKQLVSTKQYNTLVNEQKERDAELDRKLREDEERLRREEEAYYEAKREAARIAQLQKEKEEAAKLTTNGPKSWSVGEDGEWEVAGGEDDFEMFLESVRARSLKATAHLRKAPTFNDPEKKPFEKIVRKGEYAESNDGRSTNSSSTPTQFTRDRSHTEGSNSVELEWDHDEDVGIIPVKKDRSSTEEDLSYLAQQESRDSPSLSVELEWDTEFTAADDADTQSLLNTNYRHTTTAS